MAVWSVCNQSDIFTTGRMDAEYYRPEFLANERILNQINAVPLRNYLEFVRCGPFGSTITCDTYLQEGAVVARPFNIDDMFFRYSNLAFISIDDVQKKGLKLYSEGDIFFSRVGDIRVGYLAANSKYPAVTISPNIIAVRLKPNVLRSEYLTVFLNTRYGQEQIKRALKVVAQPTISTSFIPKLKVVRVCEDVEQEVSDILDSSLSASEKAKELFTQAQSLLESELGLDKLTFDKPVSYSTRFSEVAASHRLDAGHFRPQYAQLIEHIKNGRWAYLGQLAEKNWRGVQPIYVEDGEVDVVNSQHLGRQHLDYDAFAKTTKSAFMANPEAHIRYGDILIYSTGAYVGRTNVYLREKPALASNHVHIVRLHGDIDPAYMAMVLSSPVGAFQTEKHARGSAQAELYPSDIAKFVVPLIDPEKQKAIGDLVRGSLAAQDESKRLLDQAKRRVEELIEEAIAA